MLGKDYYKADPSDGKIKIGYSEGYHNQAVLIHDGYGQFVKDITLFQDDYQIKADFIIPWESMIVGNMAKLDLKVNLSKNKFPIKIDSSKKVRFVLKITDDEGSIYT